MSACATGDHRNRSRCRRPARATTPCDGMRSVWIGRPHARSAARYRTSHAIHRYQPQPPSTQMALVPGPGCPRNPHGCRRHRCVVRSVAGPAGQPAPSSKQGTPGTNDKGRSGLTPMLPVSRHDSAALFPRRTGAAGFLGYPVDVAWLYIKAALYPGRDRFGAPFARWPSAGDKPRACPGSILGRRTFQASSQR